MSNIKVSDYINENTPTATLEIQLLNSYYAEEKAQAATILVPRLQSALATRDAQIKQLREALKFAKNKMSFLAYPPDRDAEFEFCKICNNPEFHHLNNCKGVAWEDETDLLLKETEQA